MFLRFSIQNFKTFHQTAVLSLVASNYDKRSRELENVHSDVQFGFRLLKSAVVFGANASGKSVLFEALAFMKYFVVSGSVKSQKGDKIGVVPFRLNEESEKAATEFEVMFIYNSVLFRYGFEVDSERVVSEWLYYKPKTKEVELFYRHGDVVAVHPRNFQKGRMLIREGLLRDNALLLSGSAQFNDALSICVVEWFRSLNIVSGLDEAHCHRRTLQKLADPNQKEKILELLKAADLGIEDIQLKNAEWEKSAKEQPTKLNWENYVQEVNDGGEDFGEEVQTAHTKFNQNRSGVGVVHFSLAADESAGTRKFFALSGPILDALENGFTLCVDELDSKLHPNLVEKLVLLFNSTTFNKKGAQLIFNCHTTNLLSSGILRRDQIWFTEKNNLGQARLFSLSDFKTDSVRKTDSFEQNYIRGKYGALPYLGFFDFPETFFLK